MARPGEPPTCLALRDPMTVGLGQRKCQSAVRGPRSRCPNERLARAGRSSGGSRRWPRYEPRAFRPAYPFPSSRSLCSRPLRTANWGPLRSLFLCRPPWATDEIEAPMRPKVKLYWAIFWLCRAKNCEHPPTQSPKQIRLIQSPGSIARSRRSPWPGERSRGQPSTETRLFREPASQENFSEKFLHSFGESVQRMDGWPLELLATHLRTAASQVGLAPSEADRSPTRRPDMPISSPNLDQPDCAAARPGTFRCWRTSTSSNKFRRPLETPDRLTGGPTTSRVCASAGDFATTLGSGSGRLGAVFRSQSPRWVCRGVKCWTGNNALRRTRVSWKGRSARRGEPAP